VRSHGQVQTLISEITATRSHHMVTGLGNLHCVVAVNAKGDKGVK